VRWARDCFSRPLGMPGGYVPGVAIAGKRVYRQVKVEAGKLTWVEFKP